MQEIEISKVIVHRDIRQRKVVVTEGLLDSIRERGLMHPIVLSKEGDEFVLVAGERRLECFKALGKTTIPFTFRENLSDKDKRILELEENLKRDDLTWQDRAAAINSIHEQFSSLSEDWSMQKTADRLGVSATVVSGSVSVATEMAEGNEKVAKAATKNQALNITRRANDRAIAGILEELTSVTSIDAPMDTPKSSMVPASDSILNLDFNTWAETYTGPKFNLIHCDFPYGINLQKSKQGNTEGHVTYEDTPDVYYTLINTLVKHQSKLVADSASIIFWFDMAQYSETYAMLKQLDFNIYPIPMIWHKSDNKGILSDPDRRMRHIYECAFYGHCGNMKSVRAVSDHYSCPVEKAEHMSLKPEPMLRNFLGMFVDETTRMLDPTCGSGSSLRAAESLDANFVLGLELDPTVVEASRTELQLFRNKRVLAKLAAGK